MRYIPAIRNIRGLTLFRRYLSSRTASFTCWRPHKQLGYAYAAAGDQVGRAYEHRGGGAQLSRYASLTSRVAGMMVFSPVLSAPPSLELF